MAELKDSGNRREFETGAVRDMAENKGRCDLLPLDVIGGFFNGDFPIFYDIYDFQETGNIECLYAAINRFSNMFCSNNLNNESPIESNKHSCLYDEKYWTMFLEIAKHFEDGARKYGDNNWKKGIPVKFYIDSGVRHYLKYMRGDRDEPHDRAFVWNMLCAIWTCKHHPELNDYAKKEN